MSTQTLTATTATVTTPAAPVRTADYYNTLIQSAWAEIERTEDVYSQEYILEEIIELEQLRDSLAEPAAEPEPEPEPAKPEDFAHLSRMTLLDMCNHLHIATEKPVICGGGLPTEELRLRLAQHENGTLHPSKLTDRHPKVVEAMKPPTTYKPAYAFPPADKHVPTTQATVDREALERKSYRDLQAIAKQLGVKANGSKDDIIARICDPTNPENAPKPTGKKGKKERAAKNGKCVTVQPAASTNFSYRQAQTFIKWAKENVTWVAPARNSGWDNIKNNCKSLLTNSHFQKLVTQKAVLKELCELTGLAPANLASAIKGLAN